MVFEEGCTTIQQDRTLYVANLKTKTMMSEKRCAKCGETKPLSEFYFDKKHNRYYAQCKSCKLSYQKERHIKTMNDPKMHQKRLLTQLKYRERYRYKLAQKGRLERRKMGIPPQQYVNKALLLKLYEQGLPVDVIAQKCNCVPNTVRLYAYRNGIRRGHKKQRICYNCADFPCFIGIETMSSNIAKTCPSYDPNKKRKKQTD